MSLYGREIAQIFDLTKRVHEGGQLNEIEKAQFKQLCESLNNRGISDDQIEKWLDIIHVSQNVNKTLAKLTIIDAEPSEKP